MNRYTFVVQVQPEGHSTLENLETRERILITDLAEVGPRIESWLEPKDVPEPPKAKADA